MCFTSTWAERLLCKKESLVPEEAPWSLLKFVADHKIKKKKKKPPGGKICG